MSIYSDTMKTFPVIPPYIVFTLPTGQIRDPPSEILVLVSAETMLGFSPQDVNNSLNVQVRSGLSREDGGAEVVGLVGCAGLRSVEASTTDTKPHR